MSSSEAQKRKRKESLKRLTDFVEMVNKFVETPYEGESSLDSWPTTFELHGLVRAVVELGQAIGIKHTNPERFTNVIKHIDRRYTKLGISALIESLIEKLEHLPVGPVTRMRQELASDTDPKRKEQLSTLLHLVTALEWKVVVKPGFWRTLEPVLSQISNGQINAARCVQPSTVTDLNFKDASKIFDDAFGLATFIEIQRQYCLWRVRWDRKVLPVANWIYFLQEPEWDERIRCILTNPNITAEELASYYQQLRANTIKRRYREKQRRRSRPVNLSKNMPKLG